MFHHVLDAQAKGANPNLTIIQHVRDEHKRYTTEYLQAIGAPLSDVEEQRFFTIGGEAMELVKSYFEHYGTDHPLGEDFQYVATEITSEVNIPRTKNQLIFTIDGIARQVSTGKLWVVEHKTFSQKPNIDKLSTDWQMSAYLWGAEMLFPDDVFEGVIYDGISKKPGAWEKFVRHFIRMPRQILLQTEQTLISVSREMADPGVSIYPNFPWLGCFDCGVRDICKAMSFGEDVEWLLKTYYRRGSGHATVRRMDRPRSEVRSVADLERVRV
jgi:hypothetical protein